MRLSSGAAGPQATSDPPSPHCRYRNTPAAGVELQHPLGLVKPNNQTEPAVVPQLNPRDGEKARADDSLRLLLPYVEPRSGVRAVLYRHGRASISQVSAAYLGSHLGWP